MVYNYFVLFSSLLSRFKTILSCLELLCQTTLGGFLLLPIYSTVTDLARFRG